MAVGCAKCAECTYPLSNFHSIRWAEIIRMKVRNKNFGIETSSETVYFKLVCLFWSHPQTHTHTHDTHTHTHMTDTHTHTHTHTRQTHTRALPCQVAFLSKPLLQPDHVVAQYVLRMMIGQHMFYQAELIGTSGAQWVHGFEG